DRQSREADVLVTFFDNLRLLRKGAIGPLPHPYARLVRRDDEVGVERRQGQVLTKLVAEVQMVGAGREHLGDQDRMFRFQRLSISLSPVDEHIWKAHAVANMNGKGLSMHIIAATLKPYLEGGY